MPTLVRHAMTIVDRSRPSDEWVLSEEGRAAASALRLSGHARSSSEAKALETARLAGLEPTRDDRLREVRRPWSDDYAADVSRFLAGDDPPGWEPRADALARLHDALDGFDGIAVTHGLAISLPRLHGRRMACAAVPCGDRMLIRHAEPADYGAVIGVIDEWWGGREMSAMLPKLFFVHFRDTSFVAEEDGRVVGFLCGFRSQTFDDEAYIHFVGVDPDARAHGLGRALYERFFAAVAPRSVVRAVTAPVNERSVAFHRAIGFEVERVDEDYDGRGQARVLLVKRVIRD